MLAKCLSCGTYNNNRKICRKCYDRIRSRNMEEAFDVVLREWRGRWMPIVKVDESEMYRGEYCDTIEEATAKAKAKVEMIKREAT